MSGTRMVRRTSVLDEYVEAGESVVFVDGRLVVLSALATSVLAYVGGEGATQADVAAAMTAEHGEPPGGDSAGAVGALLDELQLLGLVTPVED